MAPSIQHTVNITIKQAASLLGVHTTTLTARMRKHGWSLQQALQHGPSQKRRMQVGDKHGSLTVEEVLPSKKGGNAVVVTRCDCGRQKQTLALCLRAGDVVACGACSYGKELHGMSKSRSYATWESMRRRCLDPAHKDFSAYGGRGISVCLKWSSSFLAFFNYMGERPEGQTLDRMDVNGNYEPGNCRWATPKMQANNKRVHSPVVR